MNYIPGFSNYLQAAVPRYANGGRVNYDEPTMYDGYDTGGYNELPYGGGGMLPAAQPTPTAQPMTQETVAPAAASTEAPFDLSKLDFSGLNNLSGMNFASNFGNGAAGSTGYIADPNLQYFQAPTSNSHTNTGVNGSFYTLTPDQPVRLVDLKTNTVLFEGKGYDAARKATEMAQNLTDIMGRKAQYNIQTANPAGEYTTVAHEDYNKSTLGQIADVAGTLLPLAALAIPGLGPALFGMTSGAFAASVPAQLAFGSLVGAASSGLKDQNVLKGAALGGLGAAGGAVLGPALGNATNMTSGLARAVGTGIGSTAGNLATGESLGNSLLSGALSGGLSYIAPNIQQALGGSGQGVNVGSGSGDGTVSLSGPAPIVVSGYNTPSLGLSVGSASPRTSTTTDTATTNDNPITVTGGTTLPGTNVSVGGGGGLSTLNATDLGTTTDTATTDLATTTDPITVTGGTIIPGTNISVGGRGGGLSTVNTTDLGTTTDTATTNDNPITVTGGTTVPGTNISIGGGGGGLSTVNATDLNPKTDTTDTVTTNDNPITVTGGTTIPGTNVSVGGGGGGLSTVNTADLGTTTDTATTNDNPITVTGGTTVPGTNVSIGGGGGGLSTVNATDLGTTTDTATTKDNPITVTGGTTIPGTNVSVGGGGGGLSTVNTANLGTTTNTTEDGTKKDDITVTGGKIIPGTNVSVGGGGGLSTVTATDLNPKTDTTDTKKKLGLEEYLRIAGLLSGLVGNATGGGSGQSGTYMPGGGRLGSIFSAKLPSAGGLGTIGATRTPRALGNQDWLTYATRPELNFFNYASPTTTTAGPIMTTTSNPNDAIVLDKGMLPPPAQVLTPAQMADLEKQRLEQYAYLSQFTPTAEEIARNSVLYGNNNPAGPIMTTEEKPRMAEGGAFAAKHGGPSRRTEFAVSGAGTGRSDDIPAVLSDGEYVMDAETVAMLGDGSNKAGAKKLDDLRVKIRKHKGRKLAKGRFSANAKRPEAYLSGGRI